MTALRLAAMAALTAVAVIAALLAADVRAWPAALEHGDAVYAIAPGRARWTPATNLGGLSEDMLGTAADVAARRALQGYRGVADDPQHVNSALPLGTQLVGAIDELSGPASSTDPLMASQARTLLGILTFAEAAVGGGATPGETAVADFTDAVRIDPGDTAAKFDLELLLRLAAQSRQPRRSKLAKGSGRTGRGASGSASGSGF